MWAKIWVGVFNCVLPNHNPFLQFRTGTFIISFFDSRSDDVLSWRAERTAVFSETLLFLAGCFCVGVLSFSKQFRLFAVWLLFRSIILFLPTHALRSTNTSTSPFWVLWNNWISCIPGGFLLYSNWLPFVTCTSNRPSASPLFCFAPRFPFSSTDFLLFYALVPGHLRRLCFVLCRGFLYLRLTFFCSAH